MAKVAVVQNIPIGDHRAILVDGFARELTTRGEHEIEVIMQKGEGVNISDVPYKVKFVPGDTYSIKGQLKFIYHATRKLMEGDYDIIHARNPFSSLIPSFLSKIIKKREPKIIYDIRGLWVEFGIKAGYFSPFVGKLYDMIDVRLAKMCDGVIAISPSMKSVLFEKGVKNIVGIVPTGVDVEKFSKAQPINLKEKYGIKSSVIGYVGSISVSRGSDKVIEAFKILKDSFKDAHLIMVGPIKEKEYFEEIVEIYGLEDSVIFTGMIPHNEIPSYVKSFDVAVSYFPFNHPIYDVAVPIKVIEYFAAGVPVVGTDNISHKNLIKNEFNGFLVEQKLKSLSYGVGNILHKVKLGNRLIHNSINQSKKHSFEGISVEIGNIYTNIL